MPLPYTIRQSLNIPATWFNDDGLVTLLIHGARYSGHWNISVIRDTTVAPTPQRAGTILTDYDLSRDNLTKHEGYPDLALEAAFVWLRTETKGRCWRLIYTENLNHRYPSDQKPYMTLARAVLANEHFVPLEGATYADESMP